MSQLATGQAAKPVLEPRLDCGPRGFVELAQLVRSKENQRQPIGVHREGCGHSWGPARAPRWAVETERPEAPSPALR